MKHLFSQRKIPQRIFNRFFPAVTAVGEHCRQKDVCHEWNIFGRLGRLQQHKVIAQRCRIYWIFSHKFSYFKLPLLPVTRSQTELICSTRSDGWWCSQSQTSGSCFYANTFVLGNSGTPPMLSWSCSLLQGLLGKWMHPMTPLDRAGHLKRHDGKLMWSGFTSPPSRAKCWSP